MAVFTADHGLSQVVNALLTQLDKLKHRKNVFVMSTSNLAKAIGLLLAASECTGQPLLIRRVLVSRRFCLCRPSGYHPVHRLASSRGNI